MTWLKLLAKEQSTQLKKYVLTARKSMDETILQLDKSICLGMKDHH